MYYLLRTVTVTTCCERETEMEIFMKSISKEKLQEEIKRLFDEAVENMDEDTYINNCSMEDFEDYDDYFNENNLSIHIILPTPSLDSEEIIYAIVSDEQVMEV